MIYKPAYDVHLVFVKGFKNWKIKFTQINDYFSWFSDTDGCRKCAGNKNKTEYIRENLDFFRQ